MGLPGVQQVALSHYSRSHDKTYFSGADFYVDGMNYAQRIAPHDYELHIDDTSGHSRYEQACLLAEVEIQKLERLRPRSITAVFDAMISEDKFYVRLSRAETRLRRAQMPMNVSEILAQRMATYHEHILIIYSGTEAEDEIMKLIDEDRSRARRRQFVFTGDSDIYRFNIRNSAPVEIVPHMRQALNEGRKIRTVKLQSVLHLVEEEMRVYPIIPRPGQSVRGPKISSRKYLEFINSASAHNRFFIMHGPMLIKGCSTAPHDLCPFDAGIEIRRAAYGLIMEKHFPQRPEVDTSKVEEWLQHNAKMKLTSVVPLRGENLRLAVDRLRAASALDIVKTELEGLTAKHSITREEIDCITRAINDLYFCQLKEKTYPITERTNRLYLLLKGVFKSIAFLNEVLPVRPEIDDIDKKLAGAHVQSYLMDTQESTALTQGPEALAPQQMKPTTATPSS